MARDYATIIRGLLAHAENEANPDSVRAEYRAKAEAYMREYRVAEEEALATDPGSVSPVSKVIVIRKAGTGRGDLAGHYTLVWSSIARHTGIRYRTAYDNDYSVTATVVGYEGDVRYAEFLWTAAYLMFSTRIDPTWSAERSEAENIFLLRNAGIQRREIADRAWSNGHEAAARSRVQRIYVTEAKRRGQDVVAAGLGFDTKTYREAYADEFVQTLRYRLREASDAADSTGGGLVLHGRSDRVDEAYYALFPKDRPSDGPVEAYVDPTTTCPKCQAAKTTCNDHKAWRPRAWTKADEARSQRQAYSPSARAGRSSGRSAAEAVNVQRGHTKANRLDASGRAIEG